MEIVDYHWALLGQRGRMADVILREDLDRLDLSDVDSGEATPAVTPGEVLRLSHLACPHARWPWQWMC